MQQRKMDDINKIARYIFLTIILIGLLVFWIFFKVNSAEEELTEYILPMTFSGKVIEKNIDHKNHLNRSIYIVDANNLVIQILDNSWYPIYDIAEVGDSIIKSSGTWKLNVIKDTSEKQIDYRPSRFYIHQRNWNK